MKSRNIFTILIIFFLTITSLSCKTKYDLRNEKDAADQIVKEIKTKKLIFIEENHVDVYPVYFVTKNLEKFYNAGIRYIFLEEESDNYLSDPENLNLFIMPPWGTWGNKYEYLLFEDEIKRINEVHEEDPFIVVWPETGLDYIEKDLEAPWNHIMNMRDSQAQKNIIHIIDNSNKKGMIFYGGAHGLKEPQLDENEKDEPYWKMIGAYMAEHYGNDFLTFSFSNFGNNKYRKVIYKNKDDCKILPENVFDMWKESEGFEKEFDYYCVYPHFKWGTPFCYVPEKNILNYMISLLSAENISEEKEILPQFKKSRQLFAVYYLKYHLGDKFDFDWTMPTEKLYQALENIDEKNLQNHSYDLTNLENYISWLFSGIENYLLYYPKSIDGLENDLQYFLSDMSHAQELNSRDIWPQYWTAYIQTDRAIISEKTDDYKTALQSWEKLLKNDLFYAAPIIKLAYTKMSLCAEKSGDSEKSVLYQNEAKNVTSLLDINFKYYQYFGW